ncbi:proteasome accessory factor C [Mumia flava]|uniref:Proteasome accessory factor C n=1 Tax=Mumia flava TaxID=1348852 RepID=A0A0B2B8M6_9ACTN|nr:WYL domain-containing protein [Mumia flava]PJJ53489.1 proteasome accessory factor C [Mumia flava]
MSTSGEQIERMLALVPYLQSNEGIPVEQVARLFGVSPAKIVGDLNVLWFCGLPEAVTGEMIDIDMDALESEGVVFIDNADFLPRPLRFNAYEAASLVTALRTLRESVAEEDRRALESATAKLTAALGADASVANVVEVMVEDDETPVREQIARALRDGRRLHLSYVVPSRDERTERDVDPLRLITAEGRLYLEGWCLAAEGLRLFRLDRIEHVRVLDEPAEPHPGVERREYGPRIFHPGDDAQSAVVALDPRASWVREYLQHEEIGADERGWALLRVQAGDADWLTRFVLRADGVVRVVEPGWLAERVARKTRDALAAYDDDQEAAAPSRS